MAILLRPGVEVREIDLSMYVPLPEGDRVNFPVWADEFVIVNRSW